MSLGEKNPFWRKPAHHLDLPHSHDHVHWMELFFDLIHVVMIFLLGNYLSQHHDLAGFATFFLIFMAMWLAWGETSVYNSLYVSQDWLYRISTAFQTLSIMFMAASLPSLNPSISDPGKGFVYLAVAYGMNRLILSLMYYRAMSTKAEKSTIAKEQAIRYAVLAVIYFIAALAPKAIGMGLFIFGVVMTQLYYFIPKITIMRLDRFKPRIGHFTERFALLLLIVNGEGFFKLVITLSEKGIYKVGSEVLFNVAFGGLAIFALTWLYYDLVGNKKIREGQKYLYMSWVGHLFLMLSAIMLGVAQAGEVYVGFMDTFPTFYGTIGSLGLASYLFCLLILMKSVEPDSAHRFMTPMVLITAIGFALLTFVIFKHVPAYLANLTWGIAVIYPLSMGIGRAYFALSKEM